MKADIYPIPGIQIGAVGTDFSVTEEWTENAVGIMCNIAKASLMGLSLLAGCNLRDARVANLSAQRAVQQRAISKVERFCVRLCGRDFDTDGRHYFVQLVNDYCFLGATRRPVLRADACDLLEKSAGVDPLVHIDQDHAKILRDGSLLFPGLAPGAVATGRMNDSDKGEYARLVVRQLRANKVTLSDSCHASETVFPVGKSNGQLREVWSGHTLSQHAIVPPKPPHIANPATLVFLESSKEAPIYLYKRDARCFFDQLAIPAEIQQWFGRPRLYVREMIKYGDTSLDELRRYWCGTATLTLDTIAHPLCLSWPMGFAWSSFLAQSTLLALCLRGGLKLSQILSSDRVTPNSTRCNFALATDDLMVFGRGNQSSIKHRLARVDKAIKDGGVQRHPDKDEDEKATGTAVGVDLDQGLYLAPHAPKICKLVGGLTYFLRDQPLVTIDEVQAIVGHLTWFALLNRLTFSCFCDIYDACGRLTDVRSVAEPSICFEIALFCGKTAKKCIFFRNANFLQFFLIFSELGLCRDLRFFAL